MTSPERNRRATDRPRPTAVRTRAFVRMLSADPALKAWLAHRIAKALEYAAQHLELRGERTAAEDVRRIAGAYSRGEVDPL